MDKWEATHSKIKCASKKLPPGRLGAETRGLGFSQDGFEPWSSRWSNLRPEAEPPRGRHPADDAAAAWGLPEPQSHRVLFSGTTGLPNFLFWRLVNPEGGIFGVLRIQLQKRTSKSSAYQTLERAYEEGTLGMQFNTTGTPPGPQPRARVSPLTPGGHGPFLLPPHWQRLKGREEAFEGAGGARKLKQSVRGQGSQREEGKEPRESCLSSGTGRRTETLRERKA